MSATGVGSLPGTDAWEGARIIAGELTDFLHLAELPHRGPGADLIGRTAALIAHQVGEFAAETTPQGWRLARPGGRQMRRGWSWLAEDLDALEATAQGYRAGIKVQVAGPWTLAAGLEARNGERLIADEGACRELAEALAAAVTALIGDVRRRIPGVSEVFVQCDEPWLADVARGSLDTASGLSRYAPIESPALISALSTVRAAITAAGGIAGVHACAAATPWDVVQRANMQFVSVDLLAAPPPDHMLGAMWESGVRILAGSVPALRTSPLDGTRASAPIRAAADRLGLTDHYGAITVTPTCGLAGADPQWVREAYAACRAAARILRDNREDDE
jgi:methionine synthase II (cobalamin-independent)